MPYTPPGPDIAISKLAPAISESVPANSSADIERSYTIASGTNMTIGSGGRLRII